MKYIVPFIAITLLFAPKAIGADNLLEEGLPARFEKYLDDPKHKQPLDSQHSIESLQLFGNFVVVSAGGLKQLDLASMELVPLKIEIYEQIYSVCTSGSSRFAFCLENKKPLLLHDINSSWETVDLPDAVGQKPTDWSLAAEGYRVFLISKNGECYTTELSGKSPHCWHKFCFKLHDDNWAKGNLEKVAAGFGKLFVTTNCHEFGGELYELDTKTGIGRRLYSGGTLTDLEMSANKKLWVSEGFENMGNESAQLLSYDGCGEITKHGYVQNAPKANWSYGSTVFSGISFLPNGKLIVASKDFGLFEFEKGIYKPLTAPWKERLDIFDLQTIGDLAIVSVYHQKLLVIDLSVEKSKQEKIDRRENIPSARQVPSTPSSQFKNPI